MKKRKMFKRFLKKHNAYKVFKENIRTKFKDYCYYTPISAYISCGFNWADTVNQWDYWNDLNEKWLEEIKNEKKKTV